MPTVLVVGGYGVFGGLLCRLLLRHPELRVVVAGRRLEEAQKFCAQYGGEPLAFDRDADLPALAEIRPAAVVDATGPFQAYGADPYRLARAAIAAGSDYLDLCDDAAFVVGISSLDTEARARSRVALSGASSVPGISSAAVAELRRGLDVIALIDTTILPGNRAPRGVSVVRAVVGQAGAPLRMYRGGQWIDVAGWGGLARVALAVPDAPPLSPRWASYVGVPDLALFPGRYRARSVVFRAGLELGLMHIGLWLMSWLPRLGLTTSLGPASALLHRIAEWLKPFGSDRGAMRVRIVGRDARGQNWERCWTALAERGEGPWIPVLPAYVLVRRVLAGKNESGARPCVEEVTLADIESAMAGFDMKTARAERHAPALFEQALGPRWTLLPEPVRRAHDLNDRQAFAGAADVENGRNGIARLLLWIMRMPRAGTNIPLTVVMERLGERERWTRRFGEGRFASTLWAVPQHGADAIVEQLSVLGMPLAFLVRLGGDAIGVSMPVERAWFLGVPLPRCLTPTSRTLESVDEEGRFRFDVEIRLPMIGLLLHYRGWLQPVATEE